MAECPICRRDSSFCEHRITGWCLMPNHFFGKKDDFYRDWDENLHGHQRCTLAGGTVATVSGKQPCDCPCHLVEDKTIMEEAVRELAEWTKET